MLFRSVAGRRPAGARQGELYFNFADRVIGCVDSTGKPVDIASAIAVSDTAPANPVPGQLWLNTLLTPDTLQVFMGAAATPPWASVTASVVIATEAEAIAGTDNTKMMTPLRVKQASSGAGSAVAIGDTAPTSPKAGQLW